MAANQRIDTVNKRGLFKRAGITAGVFLVCLLVALTAGTLAAQRGAAVQPPALARPVPKALPAAPTQTKAAATQAKAAPTQSKAPLTKVTPVAAAPRLSAAAAVLLDASNGKVLYSRQAHERRAPASLTKIVTAIVAIEKGNLSSVARVSSNAAGEPPSRLGLTTGDRIRLSKLLDAAIMGSSNDAATVIAEHISGSESAFAKLMNDTARRLGAKESNFRNANGLDRSGHYSTAYDMALLSRYALQKPTLAQVFAKQRVSFDWDGGRATVNNINSFLWRYSGAIGLKTGYTSNAGYSVSAAAKHGGRSLIVVLLGCPSSEARWADAAHLMDYGFKNYGALLAATTNAQKKVYVVKKGDTLYGIATRLGIRVSDIMRLNSAVAQRPDRLIPGQSLVLP